MVVAFLLLFFYSVLLTLTLMIWPWAIKQNRSTAYPSEWCPATLDLPEEQRTEKSEQESFILCENFILNLSSVSTYLQIALLLPAPSISDRIASSLSPFSLQRERWNRKPSTQILQLPTDWWMEPEVSSNQRYVLTLLKSLMVKSSMLTSGSGM